MITQDQELFELCKQVYEATGWTNCRDWYLAYHKPGGELVYDLKLNANEDKVGRDDVPLYTSDYLLEKLPKQLEHPAVNDEWHTLGVSWHIDRKEWCADYERSMLPFGSADTPLKALLKLTLALHREGLLTQLTADAQS